MMKFYKMLFMLTLIFSTLMVISSTSWMSMWIGLEINLLSVIPLFSNLKNPLSSEASMKYFITQSMASMILLFSLLNINLMSEIYILIMNSSLLMKMGSAPFHFWFPEVIEGLNWINSLILLTWQKFAPMIMIMFNIKYNFFYIIIIMSMLISGIMGLNQTSLRKILAFSSINHMGWMLASMMFNENIWLMYFIIYCLMNIFIIIMFHKMNIFYLKQLFSSMNNNIYSKMFFLMNFMSLGGLPPFIGFLPKWLTIQYLISHQMYLLSTIMIILTLMTLYFYLRIMFSTLLLNTNNINYIKNNYNMNFYTQSINFLIINNLIIITLIFNI